MTLISDYTSAELLVIVGTVVLLSLLLAEMCDWTRVLFDYDTSICNYSYDELNGPCAWKEIFPESRGERQSPINISSQCTIVVPAETLEPLTFSAEYGRFPRDFRIYNDGHSVILYARWDCDERPLICGGPLDNVYQFFNARFRWGPNDDEGSEHTIDYQRYAMELQATHVKADRKYLNLKQAAEDNAVVTISYLFQVSPVDNPYLKPLISALKKIQNPYNCASLEPAPISWYVPPFVSKYYAYCGSLTYPPCTEGVQWLVQSEPLGISANQISKFRKLSSVSGPIEVNTRPVQDLNCRDIFFYD